MMFVNFFVVCKVVWCLGLLEIGMIGDEGVEFRGEEMLEKILLVLGEFVLVILVVMLDIVVRCV